MFEMLAGAEVSSVDALLAVLGVADAGGSDADGVDRLRDLERLKAAASAAQARISDELRERAQAAHAGRRRAQGLIGHADDAGAARSVAAQVALARRESPHRGRELASFAQVLVADLPHLRALVEAGEVSEHRAMVVAGELRDLPPADRREADARLAGPGADVDLPLLGTAEVRDAARRLAFRFDPEGTEARRQRGRTRRHVASRVQPDGMSTVSALLGDLEAHAVMTDLRAATDAEIAARPAHDPDDDRTRDQVMADLLVRRLAGQVTASATPVAVHLVVPAEVLLGDDDSPAHVAGLGPVPAAVARQMVHASPEVRSTIDRLFSEGGALVAMDSRSRSFGGALRAYVGLRDGGRCRTPYCGAAVRHLDHVVAAADGGPTSAANGQGLCEACNYVKELWGWVHRPRDGDLLDAHVVDVTTPTGHRYTSRAPDLPVPIRPSVDLRWAPALGLSA